MNRVRKRAWIMMVFLCALVCGMCFFLVEFTAHGSQWVTFRGSPHVYRGNSMVWGRITDRDGTVLLETGDGREYAESAALRQATLHWLGDRQGNINTPALSLYAASMTGYDILNGIYAYGDDRGEMELTLSAPVQTAALKALDGRKGVVAVYNYKTGQILCAVTTPTYDPDNVPDIAGDTTGIWEGAYLNRFTQVTYPPGSIFKIVTTAAALEHVAGVEEMRFSCDGTYELEGSRVTCTGIHGEPDLKTALAQSCNCAFAQIAQLVGSETLADYAVKLGITGSLSFDGITTAEGNFDLAGADKVALAWSGIGQYTDMVNPCQFMTLMGAIGGGGTAAKPYLVERVSAGREITYKAKQQNMDAVFTPELAKLLGEYMRNNVKTVYGDGNFPGLTVCAKSGTSELGGDKRPNAMFAGFVADENYPLAFIVVVENGGYGASACVPVLSKVLAECKSVMDAS